MSIGIVENFDDRSWRSWNRMFVVRWRLKYARIQRNICVRHGTACVTYECKLTCVLILHSKCCAVLLTPSIIGLDAVSLHSLFLNTQCKKRELKKECKKKDLA